MASITNPFDILGDDVADNEDATQLMAQVEKAAEKPKKGTPSAPAGGQGQAGKAAKLPSKPPPPAQAVREAKNEGGRGGGRGTGRGFGRSRGGGGSYNRDSINNEASFPRDNGFSSGYKPSEEGEGGRASERRGGYGGPRGSFRVGRRGGFSNGEAEEGERPRRAFDRRSGTGRGNEVKRDGAGRGNWGTATDEVPPETEEPVIENEKNVAADKPSGEEDAADSNKDSPENEAEEKEPEDKEMTLEEYEKVREEKRKSLLASKPEERKVDVDKEFKSMLQLSNKKENDEVFIKLGSEKDKKKDAAEKDDKAKKAVSINEFLKPADTDGGYYSGGRGRGRGRGRGSRGGFGGYNRGGGAAPSITDIGQFPSLGGN